MQSKYFIASRKFELPELSPGQVSKLKRNNYVGDRIKPDNEQIYYIMIPLTTLATKAGRFLSNIMITLD